MKVISKIKAVVAFSLMTSLLTFQAYSVEIVGGGGHAAEKLILDWSKIKAGGHVNVVKFSDTILSNDLTMLQSKKIDFAIVDSPLSELELNRMNLLQFPFALSGVSVVFNLPQNLAGSLKLDGQTLGKIFSGEITRWDDSQIAALNPKHELPNKPIVIVHSGDMSSDYPVLNSYMGNVNEKWKSEDSPGRARSWPAGSIFTDGFTSRVTTVKNTSYSISFLPMQYISASFLSPVHIKNKDGKFSGLSDTGIISSASTVNIEDGRASSLSLINKGGIESWPLSNFELIVVNKDSVKEEKISQLLNIIALGLKVGSIKPTLYNYIAIPDQTAKSIVARIEIVTSGSSTASATTAPQKTNPDDMQEQLANKRRIDEELAEKKAKQRADVTAAQDLARQNEIRKAEEKAKAAKILADELAKEEALKALKAAKAAADEAARAAKAAKIAADELIEKNKLKEKAAKEQAEKEKAAEMRNQKDDDPLTAYRRSIQ